MYLSKLNNEKRHLFLDLELYLSKTDGDFSDSEKRIIDTHCIEMHIDNNRYECELSLDQVFRELREKCTTEEKRIIFIEIVAVVIADDVYHDSEKHIIERLAEVLSITENEVEYAFNAVAQMRDAYEKISGFVFQ